MDAMKRNRIDLSPYVWVGLVFVWLLVFAPHFFNSGFISDDWSVVRSALSIPGFWDLYASWFPLFSNRPVAPLVLSLVSKLCGGDPRGYVVADVTLWLTSLVLVSTIFRRFFSNRFVVIFLALASFPSMASTVIFSIGMQLPSVASIFFWALSLYFLDRYVAGNGRFCLAAEYLFVLLSLLTYEITLPLLAINVLYPSLFESQWRKGVVKKHVVRHVLPMVLLLTGILLFQKVIMPSFMTVYSRFSPGSLSNCLGNFLSWCWSFLVDFPILMLDALQSVFSSDDVNLKLVSLVVAGVFAFLLFGTGLSGSVERPDGLEARRRRLLLLIGLLTLFCASFLYVLSGSRAQIGGYANRGMTSTWIAYALVIAIIADLFWEKTLGLLVLLLIFLNVCSFVLQTENYGVSWTLQREIAASVVGKITGAKVPLKTATLLGHVPWYVPANHNGEELFQNSWDLSGALWFADHNVNLSAMPLNQLNVKQLKVDPGGLKLNYWQSDFSNLWFYEYNARFGSASLVKVSSATEAKAVAGRVAAATFNSWRPPVFVRSISLFRDQISLSLLCIIGLIYATAFSTVLRRERQKAHCVAESQKCRVCGGVLFEKAKESAPPARDVSPDDTNPNDGSSCSTYPIERCAGCGFLQSNRDETSSQQQMVEPRYESGRTSVTGPLSYVIKQLSRWVTEGRVLAVGAGAGILVEDALARGFLAEGIEPSERMVLMAEKRGLPFVGGSLTDERVAGPYVAVTLVHFIEDVSDPVLVLAHIHNLLDSGGYLVIATPDADSLTAKVMGQQWRHFRLAHRSCFTQHTATLLLQRCGYEVVDVSRPKRYLELRYLFAQLLPFLSAVPSTLSALVAPLDMVDSMLLVCRKK